MNITKKELELLSAYLDGELSQEEKQIIEDKIKSSIELQNELAYLKKIKETTSSVYSKLDESPYLETRVSAKLSEKRSFGSLIYKWSPAIAVAVLTIGVMALLKFNPDFFDNLIEEQTTNIAGFYKENLQPLLIAADLTNEDIFNFAFYQQLPLDKQDNQYLLLGYDPDGAEFFEIKKAKFVEETGNLEKFVTMMELNDIQKKQIDSIINNYAVELSEQILVNEKSTVAINPNLWNYQKAIAADILRFVRNNSRPQVVNLMPAEFNRFDEKVYVKMVNEVKENKKDNYIFFTPDSVFSEEYEFELEEVEKELAKVKEELRREEKHLKNFNFEFKFDSNFVVWKDKKEISKDFNVSFDSNFFKVKVNNIPLPEIEQFDFDSLARVIEITTEKLKHITVNAPRVKKQNIRLEVKAPDSSSYLYKIEVNEDVDIRDSIPAPEWQHMDIQISPDSILKNMQFLMKDSMDWHFDTEELREEMKQLKKEMQQFRKEMKELKKQDEAEVEPKEPEEPEVVKIIET